MSCYNNIHWGQATFGTSLLLMETVPLEEGCPTGRARNGWGAAYIYVALQNIKSESRLHTYMN